MATQTETNQSSLKLIKLQEEMGILRSAIISVIGEDDEGDYNPMFVEDILKAMHEKPTRTFKSTTLFLSELAKA